MGSPEFTDSPRYPELSPDTRQTVRVRLPARPTPAAANITQQLGWTGGYRIGKRHSVVGVFGYRVPHPESITPATAADIDRPACAGIQTPWYATCLNDISPLRAQPRPPLPRPQAPVTPTSDPPPHPWPRYHPVRPRRLTTAPGYEKPRLPITLANRAPIAQLVELRTFNPHVTPPLTCENDTIVGQKWGKDPEGDSEKQEGRRPDGQRPFETRCPCRARTCDLVIKSHQLYQLS